MAEFHAVISGRVQGVGFRYFAQRAAAGRDIRGFARNLPGGDVEVAARGPRPALEAFLGDLGKGPSMSRVENVRVTWNGTDQKFNDFSIRF